MSEFGQMHMNTDRCKSIIEIIKNNKPKNIVEIGTWKGGGSTLCVLTALDYDSNFISLEVSKEFYDIATKQLSEYNDKIKLLHGRIVDTNDVIKFFGSINLNDNPIVTQEQHVNWFLEDLKNIEQCENIFHLLPDKIDFLILDGGEYSTYCEWEKLKDRVDIVAIDDASMVKSKKIYNELIKDENYICIKDIGYEGNGFYIFQRAQKQITFKNNTIDNNVIITATNSSYYESLLTLISSTHKFGYDTIDKIIVYDIGLTNEEINNLKEIEKVEIYTFNEQEIISHDSFLDGKSHVYKNYCLKNASEKYKNVLWIDSGACFINDFSEIFSIIDSDDIFLVGDIHLNNDYTHNECKEIMNITQEELMANQLWSGVVGFKSNGKYQKLIDEASEYSLIPNCCNGNHQNHRHDQTILSILSFRYNCPQHNIDKFGYWTDANRNLRLALEMKSIVFAHRRGYINKEDIKYKNVTNLGENIVKQSSIIKKPIVGNVIKLIDENLQGQDGLSKHVSPNTGWVRDLGETNYDIGIYTDRLINFDIDGNKTNFAWLIEPPIINGDNYNNVKNKHKDFKYVFSYKKDLTNFIDNFKFVFHGGTHLRDNDINIFEKTKNVSMIYSDKNWNMGHRLRKTISDGIKESGVEVDFYGSGEGKYLDYKIHGLKDYRFSICFENSVEDDYFTEKIIDCFLTGTIPIYWGTKNIGNYFDSNGIITFESTNEWGVDLNEVLTKISLLDEKYYTDRFDSVVKNYELAKKYIHPEYEIMNFINDKVEKPKLNINEIPKIVINLDRRNDRLEKFEKEMEYMSWTYERFSGIDVNSYIGCALSHVEIAKMMLERGYDYLLVMEDDIFFMPYAKETLKKVENNLNEIDWDFFHFAPSIHRPLNLFSEDLVDLSNPPEKKLDIHRGILGTSAFILTKKSAEIILNWDTGKYIENSDRCIAIDEYFDRVLYPATKSYSASLPIVIQRNEYSDINHTFDNNHYIMTYQWNAMMPKKLNQKYLDSDYCYKEREQKKTKIITAIYSDLFGTKFGGRQSRKEFYRYSLLSLLKMTDADFVCYTSDREINDLEEFFYNHHKISSTKLKLIIYDLEKTNKTELIYQYKNVEETSNSDRCVDIQYCKFEWLSDNLDGDYEYYFWLDAGLSHSGLIPVKYLSNEGYRGYFESILFNNTFLKNLITFTDDKIFLIGKENLRNYWSGTVNPIHFKKYDSSYHIIGGLFGGRLDQVKEFVNLFDENINVITKHDNRLYHEEDIMTLIWRNNEEKFNVQFFDTWWHENERVSGVDMEELLQHNKSFYKILEELNDLI